MPFPGSRVMVTTTQIVARYDSSVTVTFKVASLSRITPKKRIKDRDVYSRSPNLVIKGSNIYCQWKLDGGYRVSIQVKAR